MNSHQVRWQVSTNKGDTFFEGKGNFTEIEGDLSPWQKLQKHLQETGAAITSLALTTKDGRTFNLPSAGKNPKFSEFANLEPPIDFWCERKMSREMAMIDDKPGAIKISDWYTIAIAEYPTYELQLWVDETDPRNCWTLVKSKGGEK
jgi:hypothetical protein